MVSTMHDMSKLDDTHFANSLSRSLHHTQQQQQKHLVESDPPLIRGWRSYPVGLKASNPFTAPSRMYDEQLRLQAQTVFSDESKLRVMDYDRVADIPRCDSRLYEKPGEIDAFLSQPDDKLPRIRIISIHSRNTVMPLNVTEATMRKILTRYRIDPAFLSVIFSFGSEPHLTETGNNNLRNIRRPDGSREICYLTRYAEENHRSRTTPWSVRHTGVYHFHSASNDFDLFIILHPIPNSLLEQQLGTLDTTALETIITNPYTFHFLPFSSYLSNWRWYFRHIGEDFERKNDDIFGLDLKSSVPASATFDMVQGLRHLLDTVMSLSAFCQADLGTLKELDSIKDVSSEGLGLMEPFGAQLQGYQESLSALSRRIRNAIDLLAYWLDLQNQDTAGEVNNHLLSLQKVTVDDSATVKGITFLSLIYLPGSFVATMFGMNFFMFDDVTMRIAISNDFWIFISVWFPLTLVTFIGYTIIMLRKKKHPKRGWTPMTIVTAGMAGLGSEEKGV